MSTTKSASSVSTRIDMMWPMTDPTLPPDDRPTPNEQPSRNMRLRADEYLTDPWWIRTPFFSFIVGLVGGLLMALAVYWLIYSGKVSSENLVNYTGAALALLSGALASYVASSPSRRLQRLRGDGPSFLDIDRSAQRQAGTTEESKGVIAEIRRLASAVSADRADVEDLIERVKAQADAAATVAPPDSFHAQMFVNVRVLEEKAKLADEKASVLLDRGVAYSRFGIGFFIVAIVTWQALAWWRGFETQLIFGIASSTVLFVFLQFLSSWFLKQYRHFIEVSTYLIEIKSVFDRYTLLYMLIRESSGKEQPDLAPMSALVSALKEEMKWPRARPGFTDDVYYAKDAIGSTEEIVKIVRLGSDARDPAKPK